MSLPRHAHPRTAQVTRELATGLRAAAPRHAAPSRLRPLLAAGGIATALLLVDGTALSASAAAAGNDSLARLRDCESGGNYRINTGNGYYGAYQFDAQTWRSLGYSGLPHHASPATQDEAAIRLQAQRGWSPWPSCSRRLGLRGSAGSVSPVRRAPVDPGASSAFTPDPEITERVVRTQAKAEAAARAERAAAERERAAARARSAPPAAAAPTPPAAPDSAPAASGPAASGTAASGPAASGPGDAAVAQVATPPTAPSSVSPAPSLPVLPVAGADHWRLWLPAAG